MDSHSTVTDQPPEAVSAGELDRALREIVARARPLSERRRGMDLPGAFAPPYVTNTVHRRLARWREVVTYGNKERFYRRLQWEDWDSGAAAWLMADVDLGRAGPLPAWAMTLRTIIETSRNWGSTREEVLPFSRAPDSQVPRPFQEILAPVVVAARKQLREHLGPLALESRCFHTLLLEPACLSLERALLDRLVFATSRTLYAEFLQHRAVGRSLLLLFGVEPTSPPSATQYRSFVKGLLQDGLVSLFSSYPVLARLVALIVAFWAEATAEFIQRLEADYGALVYRFNQTSRSGEIGKIIDIEAGLSDPHRGGRSVMAITFENGLRVVYKPKDIGLEDAYTRLLTWCNEHGAPLLLQAQWVLLRDGYGWAEYITHRPCQNAEALHRFYQRAGMLLCLLYGIGATDCHAENLIASGEQPVLVDMETLLHPQPTPIADDPGFFDSVLRTGLLPRWECQHHTRDVLDLSGLGFAGPQFILQRQWRSINTDDIHVAWEPQILPPTKNVPSLAENPIGPDNYVDDLLAGFRLMYRFLLSHRETLLAPDGPLAAFCGQRVRFIFRATHIYFRILEQSLTPDHLKSGTDWSIELDHLALAFLVAREKPRAWPILRAELEGLERLDLPYFESSATDLESTDLAQPIERYFRASGYDQMIARLARLDETDLALQSRIIQGTVYTLSASGHPIDGILTREELHGMQGRMGVSDPAPHLTPEAFLDAALAIGHTLQRSAIKVAEDRLSWVGLTFILNTERFQVNLLSANLYDGVCGVALFLAALDHATGGAQFRDLAFQAIEPLRSLFRASSDEGIRRMVQRIGIGGALGFGSILYAFSKLGQFLGATALLAEAAHAASALPLEAIHTDEKLDVVGGAAGTILGLLALYEVTGERRLRDKAAVCGQHLLGKQISQGPLRGAWKTMEQTAPLTGFSHGVTGIAYALVRLYATTGDETYLSAAEQGFAYERTAGTTRIAPGIHTERSNGARMVSWCHGAPGISLARLGSLRFVGSDELRRDARGGVDYTVEYGMRDFDHICCGNFGRIESLLVGAEVLQHPHFRRTACAWASTIIARMKQSGSYHLRSHFPSERHFVNPPLFQGLAGIGYQLLRLASPATVPSLLLWE